MALKLFSALLILFFASHGLGAPCSLSNIVISQAATGKIVEGMREFKVVISNNCYCAQSQVIVRCFGLSSVEPVDRSAIVPLNSENCLVKNGGPITKTSPVIFKYAWKTPQDFPLVSSNVRC
ncbi:hypothetical protein IEQ34_004129 [Dendrobium chrysotoxum]|uniref:Uncharacterized protein n=1 Tax=Dendrobium chrysotoxum TaxID=161865 RepID=A0AAV7HD07_DENCH|nr:hypothetical protein IEQ34_004129 [Dendrobium chrysotoxum]